MFSFKTFLKETDLKFGYVDLLLFEELTQEQKNTVDNWGDGSAARALSNHVFPKGQDRLEIPLKMDEGPVEPHPDVQKHLEDNGYTITDYKGGYAEDKYGRKTSIGKILNKTKAPQDITSAFLNDPKRAASSIAQPKIIISRHPHDVAGMSTDRGWRSCMTMGSGCNEHYLKHDIQQGTHVAYLVRPEDNDIKKPMARIALKPFHTQKEDDWVNRLHSLPDYGDDPMAGFDPDQIRWADDPNPPPMINPFGPDSKKVTMPPSDSNQSSDSDHTILRPESNVYGIGKSGNNNDPYDNKAEGIDSGILGAFKKSVKSWASENFPMREGTTYEKNDSVYNDDGRTTIMPFEKQIKHENSDLVARAFEDHSDKITPEHVEYGINHRSPSVREAAVKHDLSTPEQVLKISHDRTYEARRAALKNPKLPQARLEDVLLNVGGDDYAQEDRYSALKNPNVPSPLLDAIVKDKDDDLRYDAIQHPNVWSETLGEIARSSHYKDSNLIGLAVKHPNFKANQIHDFLDNPAISSFAKQKVFKNPNITSDHVSKVLNDKNSNRDLINAAIEHPKAGAKNLENYFSNDNISNYDKMKVLTSHPKITSKHIDTIMGLSQKKEMDDVGILKTSAITHNSTSPETIENVINNYPKQSYIRNSALTNGKVKSSKLEQIFNDPDESEYAKFSILRNPNVSSNILMSAIKGDSEGLTQTALQHPTGLTQEHAEAGFSHPNPNVRAYMFDDNSKFLRKEHIINALGDPSDKVRRVASSHRFKLDNNDFIQAMSHPNVEVRRSAVFLDTLTREAHSMAVKDEDPKVRAYSVLNNHYVTPSHVEKFVNDPDPSVRALSTMTKHITPEHLNQLANDPESNVRLSVAMSNKTDLDLLKHLSENDASRKVREEASRQLTSRKLTSA